MTQITIRTMTLAGKELELQIEAELVGCFAIHIADGVEVLDGSEAWSLTYVASGKRASPFYFPTADQCRAVANCLSALPVDWGNLVTLSADRRAALRETVYAVSDFCGGFLIDTRIDNPVGSA